LFQDLLTAGKKALTVLSRAICVGIIGNTNKVTVNVHLSVCPSARLDSGRNQGLSASGTIEH
jgi:hypothetical protein